MERIQISKALTISQQIIHLNKKDINLLKMKD